MICKFQRPIGGDLSEVQAILVYDERRNVHFVFDSDTPTGIDLLARFGDRFKFYAQCSVEDGALVIGEDVPDEAW
jgi:hypothetical protein